MIWGQILKLPTLISNSKVSKDESISSRRRSFCYKLTFIKYRGFILIFYISFLFITLI